MTFDEQLTRAFETLSERLRGDVDAQLRRTAADLATAHQDALEQGLAAGREAARQEAAVEHARQVEPAPQIDPALGERLSEGVRSIARAHTLTDILDMLTIAARREAVRADVWLTRGGRPHQWRAPGAEDAPQDSPSGSVVLPIEIAGSEVAALYADFGGDTADLEQRTSNVEILTRFAGRSLEALTAFKAARALTGQPAAAAAAAAVDEAGEEITSARRYARLLVSEIKLYHESAVIEGRRDRDLATRLGGEIARARVMYEQRVPPDVRARGDYFQDELVRTLADGDATLLQLT